MIKLSPTETKVARLMANGTSVIGTSDILGRSSGTVSVHRSAIYRKLGVDGLQGFMLWAMRHGWMEDD